MIRTLLPLAVLAGCQPAADDTGAGTPADTSVHELGDVLPAFALEDTNPTSATYGGSLSPADFAGDVSAWYFGHAT